MTEEELQRLATKLGADIPSPGQVIRWFATKSPEGILVLAIAFDLGAIGLWILGYAFKVLGWFQ